MLSQALPVFQNLWEYPKLHELGFQVGLLQKKYA